MHQLRLAAVVTLVLGAVAVAGAADVPIVGLKLIVIDKGSAGKAKVVFVAKDVAITKGAGTDPSQIEATLEIEYDAARGAFVMPQGPNWIANKANVGKYANQAAPSGGVVKVGLIKPGTLLKLVGRGLGDTPLDISTGPTGDVYVAATIVNGGEETRLCTRFSDCTHKPIAGGAGYKLLCKGGSSGDPTCSAAPARCPAVPPAPVGGSYATCTTDIASGTTCALSCADGYTHAGTDPLCDDGAFVGVATCVPASCAPLAEPFTTSDCATAAVGSTCSVQCLPGHHRSDGGAGSSVTATCSGVAPGAAAWTHPTFTCAPDPCPTAPPAPAGGSYDCTTDIPSGTTCTLTCAAGYTRVGTTDPTCQLGAFTGGDTTCVPASCAPLVGSTITTNCATGALGTTCSVQCAPGHQRTDGGVGPSVTATCTGTAPGVASWTHPPFTCEPYPCVGSPPPPVGGSYPTCAGTVPSGQSCPLACADGYSHDGGTDPSCYLGNYNGTTSTCVPANCAPLPDADPWYTAPYTISDCETAPTGATCTVQCQPAHIRVDGGGPPNSSVTGTCTGSGPGTSAWTHPTFTCMPQPCLNPPPAPVGGSYPTCATPPVASGTDCPLVCADGYANTGGPHLTCFLGSYNGTASCAPSPMMGAILPDLSLAVAPAGLLASGTAGLNGATLLPVLIAVLQLIRRRRR